MKKLAITLLFLMGIGTAQADMLDALKAYENKDYAIAQEEFAALIPFGNELAAYNLGAMYYRGEGLQQNIAQAMAYFMLAAELKHESAAEVLHKVKSVAEPELYDQAEQTLVKLRQQVVIGNGIDDNRSVTAEIINTPNPAKRVLPEYPLEAASKGKYGYVNLRFLVDEMGKVQAVDVLDSFPKNLFEQSAITALKAWEYERSEQKHLLKVRFDFSMVGKIRMSKIKSFVDESNLWTYAIWGSPRHQLVLGTLLELVSIQSANEHQVSNELPVPAELDYSVLEPLRDLPKVGFAGFWGSALVRVEKNGTIISQLSSDFEEKSKVRSLIGLKLKGKIDTDIYRITRYSDQNMSDVRVRASFLIPKEMSGYYWWEQAAKNGDLEAQRIVAAQKGGDWERYLLEKQDSHVMAWVGAQMVLDGKRNEGLLLLDKAIAGNYEPAIDLKKQFM